MAWVAGADGCKGGWVLVTRNAATKELTWAVVKTLSCAFDLHRVLEVLAVDVPIGLRDVGSRECDLIARRHLGPVRGRSVFTAPIRPMLEADSHQTACAIGKEIEGRALSLQSWAIAPKIKEIDQLLRESPGYRRVIREVHPEVSFSLLNGAPIVPTKSKSFGRATRKALLEPLFGHSIDAAMRDCRSHGAKPDDVLDAFAALWTADRILFGKHQSFPTHPESDRFGLAMEILA